MNHNNNFNFLRLFAAILVAITHSYAITGHIANEPLHNITNGAFYFSKVGLYFFFFTSGYLVTLSASKSKTSIIYLQKRILRIYPALIAIVLVSIFIAGPLLTVMNTRRYFTDTDTWKYLWTATGLKIRFRLPGVFENPQFFMTGFDGSLWSLKLELEMYFLVFILFAARIIKRQKLFSIVLISIIILLLILNIKKQFSILIPDHKNLLLACAFLFGGIVQTKTLSHKFITYLFIASSVLLIGKIIRIIKIDLMLDEVIFFSLLAYFIAFSKKFLLHVKYDISYGMYIYAFPLQQFFFQASGFNQPTFVNLVFSMSCAAIFAFFSWIYIEHPALKLKETLS